MFFSNSKNYYNQYRPSTSSKIYSDHFFNIYNYIQLLTIIYKKSRWSIFIVCPINFGYVLPVMMDGSVAFYRYLCVQIKQKCAFVVTKNRIKE